MYRPGKAVAVRAIVEQRPGVIGRRSLILKESRRYAAQVVKPQRRPHGHQQKGGGQFRGAIGGKALAYPLQHRPRIIPFLADSLPSFPRMGEDGRKVGGNPEIRALAG